MENNNKKLMLSTTLTVITVIVFILSFTGAKISKAVKLLAFAAEVILAVLLFKNDSSSECDDIDFDEDFLDEEDSDEDPSSEEAEMKF